MCRPALWPSSRISTNAISYPRPAWRTTTRPATTTTTASSRPWIPITLRPSWIRRSPAVACRSRQSATTTNRSTPANNRKTRRPPPPPYPSVASTEPSRYPPRPRTNWTVPPTRTRINRPTECNRMCTLLVHCILTWRRLVQCVLTWRLLVQSILTWRLLVQCVLLVHCILTWRLLVQCVLLVRCVLTWELTFV